MNKRPLTAKPKEAFGDFTSSTFQLTSEGASLKALLSLEKQNVVMLDMRGEGTAAMKMYNEYHVLGSVSFPHGWLNRANHMCALQRFRNLENKIVIVFMDNER